MKSDTHMEILIPRMANIMKIYKFNMVDPFNM